MAQRFMPPLAGFLFVLSVTRGSAATRLHPCLLYNASPRLKVPRTFSPININLSGRIEFLEIPKLEIAEITKDALYVGLRISFTADVAGVHCDMKVDIGFSDEVYPTALILDYPATLDGIPGARLQCYSLESVVAEKWQAMVQLKQMNSRMKDFYDLWFLSRRYSFTYATLQEAITRTFERRETEAKEYTALKAENYQKAQQAEWAADIRKLKAASFQNGIGL